MGLSASLQRKLVGLLVAGLVALVTWFVQAQGDDAPPPDRSEQSAPGDSGEPGDPGDPGDSGAETDPHSGLRWVSLDELPPEAAETVELIEDDGPFLYDRDGVVFQNREGILPDEQRGYYREYTVPTPGEDDRGARRIVTGSSGEYYWTPDHYRSFERIRR